eukprot:CAMPEP_0184342038 /NCGR_PEP_ID=MMETSP1089-20130417/10662_1 /TAXON_ID=38269 ORGANISM="Gloeochaete wittrockiana, Strain SAG46.84" /NCGR_SAMPLE_ID=MMETSP1089 /ASSEMBLY_ACC=CAM_ASM_000445 /LENGTH=64 /DNA_ID=CAMNT_0026670697 /DNA_START=814 /DNA_END=1008 /DNA_ORIENTATION=-
MSKCAPNLSKVGRSTSATKSSGGEVDTCVPPLSSTVKGPGEKNKMGRAICDNNEMDPAVCGSAL